MSTVAQVSELRPCVTSTHRQSAARSVSAKRRAEVLTKAVAPLDADNAVNGILLEASCSLDLALESLETMLDHERGLGSVFTVLLAVQRRLDVARELHEDCSAEGRKSVADEDRKATPVSGTMPSPAMPTRSASDDDEASARVTTLVAKGEKIVSQLLSDAVARRDYEAARECIDLHAQLACGAFGSAIERSWSPRASVPMSGALMLHASEAADALGGDFQAAVRGMLLTARSVGDAVGCSRTDVVVWALSVASA